MGEREGGLGDEEMKQKGIGGCQFPIVNRELQVAHFIFFTSARTRAGVMAISCILTPTAS
jgi:hypothetical protein